MAYTGARVGAVTALRLQDLRDHGGFRTFWFREKRGREREVPVRHDLDEWLAAYLATAGVDGDPRQAAFSRPLAPGRDAFEARPLQLWTIRTVLKRRLKRAGLPHIISPRASRAMVVTDLLSHGVSTEHVQFLVGHARPSATQLYDRRAKKGGHPQHCRTHFRLMAELDLPRGPREIFQAVHGPLVRAFGGEENIRFGWGTALAARLRAPPQR